MSIPRLCQRLPRFRQSRLGIVLAVISIGLPVAAQPPLLPPRSADSSYDTESRSGYRQALQQLRRHKRELTGYVARSNDIERLDEPPVESAQPDVARPIVEIHDQLDEMRHQKESRVGRIKLHLLELQHRLQERREAEELARQQAAAAATPPPGEAAAQGNPAATNATPGQGSPAPDGSSAAPPGDPAAPGASKPQPSADPFSPAEAILVSSKAVDRLELANSLFAIGRTDSALAIYGAIDQKGLSDDDRVWLDYQLASCHRRVGNVAEAEKIYRRVVAANPESAWSEYSRWWLDLLRDRNQASQELESLKQVLDTYRTSAEPIDAK